LPDDPWRTLVLVVVAQDRDHGRSSGGCGRERQIACRRPAVTPDPSRSVAVAKQTEPIGLGNLGRLGDVVIASVLDTETSSPVISASKKRATSGAVETIAPVVHAALG
jgi:hypothetical protein